MQPSSPFARSWSKRHLAAPNRLQAQARKTDIKTQAVFEGSQRQSCRSCLFQVCRKASHPSLGGRKNDSLQLCTENDQHDVLGSDGATFQAQARIAASRRTVKQLPLFSPACLLTYSCAAERKAADVKLRIVSSLPHSQHRWQSENQEEARHGSLLPWSGRLCHRTPL